MKYFSIAELCKSDTAARLGISNNPTKEIEASLVSLIDNCLDKIRENYGKPIKVSSGYRCPRLNQAVGGSKTSQHMRGEAADLVPMKGGKYEDLFLACIAFGGFDQLIIEQSGGSRWIHVSYSPSGIQRKKILSYRNGMYTDITKTWKDKSYLWRI